MKNSEMKTIIRHIDRLTHKLNVKGRRRDAGPKAEQQIYVAADKIDQIVNSLCKTLEHNDVDMDEFETALKESQDSFSKQANFRLNSIFKKRAREYSKAGKWYRVI